MTVPNVTMTWCRKKSNCKWCEQPIEQATPVVTVFFWNKGNDNNRRWNVKQFYHPECWIKQGLDYLSRNPFVSKQKGRSGRKTTMCEEDRRKRFLLVRRFHALYQRRNNIDMNYPDNLITEANLTQQMVDLIVEATTLGGVPKGWVEKL